MHTIDPSKDAVCCTASPTRCSNSSELTNDAPEVEDSCCRSVKINLLQFLFEVKI